MHWPLAEAQVRFGDLLQDSLRHGPQIVTREGVDMAVVVPIEQWRELNRRATPTLKTLLLAPEPMVEDLTAERLNLQGRPPPDLE